MTTDWKALCVELTEVLRRQHDWYIEDNGYGLQQLEALLRRADAALSEPEPEGPTRRQLMMLADDMGMVSVGAVIPAEYARAVLARWGNHPVSPDSSPQPFPVSERLPGPGEVEA